MTRQDLTLCLPLCLPPVVAAALLAGCAGYSEPAGPPARETIHAVTTSHRLIEFNAGQPHKVVSSKPLTGLAAQERLIGIDYRVAKGQLFGLGISGQLYRIDTAKGEATPIGAPAVLPREGASEWGFDFNPVVDRMRVVNDAGSSLRMHPDTGAIVDADPNAPGVQLDGRLAYDAADAGTGKVPAVLAVGYSYNKNDDKLTTMYALDGRQGALVHAGSKEGVQPVVSPNTGRLFTVGSLGIGAFESATLDISDVSNAAYAAVSRGMASSWYRIDLATGRATLVGTIAGGEAVVGAAIVP